MLLTASKILNTTLAALFFLFVSVMAVAETPSAVTINQQILEQLLELKRELKLLRSETAQLRQAVTEIHRATTLPTPTAAPPSQPGKRVDITLEKNDPVLGDKQARIGLVEFSDYQCPFCSRFHSQTFPQLKEQYIDTGRVQYIMRDLPLDFHAEAEGAAIAANCADEQGAYWHMKEQLFKNQRRLSESLYIELAENLKLNRSQFIACLKKPAHRAEIKGDLSYAQTLGITGTPSFFVGKLRNGHLVDAIKITGAQPVTVFERAIDKLLLQ